MKLYLYDHNLENERFIKTIAIIAISIILLSGILLTRLFFLQFISTNKYKTLSNNNQLAIIPIEPKRGMIYDRNGKLLADNQPIYNLDIIPQFAKNIRLTLKKVTKIIPISDEEITEILKKKNWHRPFEPITIKSNLSEQEIAKIAVHSHKIPGLKISAKLIRKYPYHEYLGHIVGYTSLITAQEFESIDGGNYLSNQLIGKMGIEKQYESELRGKLGYKQVEIDAKGHVVRTKNIYPPIAGSDLHLSIDIKLQKKVSEILTPYVGAAVVIDTKSGELLAMVSSPSFDPNSFTNKIDHKTFQKIINNPNKPQFNRAINGLYPLASTIKPIMALQGLEQGIIDTSYQLYDPGWYKLPNNDQIFNDIAWRRGGHGWVNLDRSIIVSCDTYYYHLAKLLGIDKMHKILDQFGFGKKTNVDLTQEADGLVPSPKWKKQFKNESWYTGDTLITGIGQGFMLTTPIQLAQSTMLLAGKGKGYKPHLLTKIVDSDNTSITYSPEKLPEIKLRKQNFWNVIHTAMHGVITHKEGSGRRFGNKTKYSAAGKTGTGQVYSAKFHKHHDQANLPSHLRDHSLFIAFAPLESPTVALSVILENTSGAPAIARQILDTYFDNN